MKLAVSPLPRRLLTEHQKMELHSKALKYLQQHTRRCTACGELQFVKLLGKTIAQEIKTRRLTIDQLRDIERFGEATTIHEKATNGTPG